MQCKLPSYVNQFVQFNALRGVYSGCGMFVQLQRTAVLSQRTRVNHMKRHFRFTSAATAGLLATTLVLGGCGSDSTTLVAGPSADNTGTDGDMQSSNEGGMDTDSTGDGTDTGTDAGGDTDNSNPDSASQNNEFEARYRATFNSTWSAATHPTNFPDNPHFSPLTGAVHSEQSRVWELGQIASDGIEEMAESGGTGILKTELQSIIDEGRALSLIEGGGIANSPGSVSVEFTINRDNSLVTLVSMMAPSPDWFIGVNGLPLIDQNGDFVSSITIDARLYDSGTDSGTRYTSADEDTSPRSPISLVSSFPPESDFMDGAPFAGQLVVEKI